MANREQTRRKQATRRRHVNTRRQRIRQRGRQRGGVQDKEIRALVEHYFPEFSRGIRVDKGHVFLTCPATNASANASTNAIPDPNFIHFHIAPPHMMLHYLRRCPGISGTEILQRIITIGQALSLHTIELHDASLIRCDFPLYTLSILQHGETWYNRMGFLSPTHATDKEINDALRHMNWEDFVHEMFHKHDARIGRDPKKVEGRIITYLTRWYRAFPDTRGQTVTEIVNRINWKGIPCDHPHTPLLRDFLDMADSVLEYNSNVTLDLRSQDA
jgi:hypothetical protein